MDNEEKWQDCEEQEAIDDLGTMGRGFIKMGGYGIAATLIGGPVAGAIAVAIEGYRTGRRLDKRNARRNQKE